MAPHNPCRTAHVKSAMVQFAALIVPYEAGSACVGSVLRDGSER